MLITTMQARVVKQVKECSMVKDYYIPVLCCTQSIARRIQRKNLQAIAYTLCEHNILRKNHMHDILQQYLSKF